MYSYLPKVFRIIKYKFKFTIGNITITVNTKHTRNNLSHQVSTAIFY